MPTATLIPTEMAPEDIGLPTEIRLDMIVRDPDTLLELWHRQEPERSTFALSALRLGVLAIRQASGTIDGSTIRQEGERLVGAVRELLAERSTQLSEQLGAALKSYFDPANGQLPQRLDRLVKNGGEIEAVLRQYLDGDGSALARTLAQHVGQNSPLLRKLSPDQSDGILAALTTTIEKALEEQRQHVLAEFSLDQEDSALSRLVKQLTDTNGQFRAELAQDMTKLAAEFSLDNEEGALSRLVQQVDRAQRAIVEQFSADNENSALRRMSKLLETTNAAIRASLTLDDEKSPLSTLRRELMQVLADQNKANSEFQTLVRTTLEAMQVRRQEQNRSPAHGGAFEDQVGDALQTEAQRAGDLFDRVGTTAGKISRSKTGDHVITLGPDAAASGSRIVIEAKADKSYTLSKALAELKVARDNRDAQVGIFVFSRGTAPEGMEPLERYGQDLVVIWDHDDPRSDVYLKGAYSIARALVVRQQRAVDKSKADFSEIEKAVSRITTSANLLQEITTSANTVKSSGQKIVDRAAKLENELEVQLEILTDHVQRLKSELAPDAED